MTLIHLTMVDCPMKLLITRYSHHYEVTKHQWMAPDIMRSFIKRFLHIATYRDRHGVLHEDHFFELAGNLPVEVVFMISDEEAAQFLKLIEREKVHAFYVLMPAECGVTNGEQAPPEPG